jgi:hypothetical protein
MDTPATFGAPPLCPCQKDFAEPAHGRREITMMNRRIFSAAMVAGAAASLISTRGMAATRL